MSTGVQGLVAVCFTDLAGSTELMGGVGERAWDALRDGHFAALRAVLPAHGGEEVKCTGDGIMAVFASAAEAVDAAVGFQRAAEAHARRAGAPLRIRVGLALGDVTRQDGDVFGTPVVEAARLVATAVPGQILCTALVRAVAGTRTAARFSDVGALDLKGLPEPVPAFEVAWDPGEAGARPLPPLLTGAGRLFVGRTKLLADLGQAWKEVVLGQRRLVLLGGEPGIGKTRLAAELARGLADEGALVLAGRCDEDLGVPYQPFVEALRHYLAHDEGNPRLGRHGGELTRLVPELAAGAFGLAPPLRADPETERYRLFDAVAAWLSDVSLETPVLLVLDDLHWAAKPTVLLLRHVLRSAEPLQVLALATYRDTDIARGDPLAELLADVPRLPGAARWPVGGLDAPDVTAFLERAAGHDLDEDGEALARLVWRETEGNSFFVVEVIRHLIESGAVAERDGRWTVTGRGGDVPIPDGVRDVVGRRLARLADEANRVLACAAVIGLEFEPAVVAAAGDFGEEVVVAALDAGAAARLVVEVAGPVPRNRFAHALVRATLYDDLSAARRALLHRRVAEALETTYGHCLDDHLPALAHHWARAVASPAHTEKAVDYAHRAGDRALAQLAHDEAAGWYRSGLELLEAGAGPVDDGRRLSLLLALGEAQRRAGDPAFRETFLSAAALARERGDGAALVRAALANFRGAWSTTGGVDEARVATLRAALGAVGPDDVDSRARLLARLASETIFAGDDEGCRRLMDEALALARRGSRETLAAVLIGRAWAWSGPDAVTDRAAVAAELLSLAEAMDDPGTLFWAVLLHSRSLVESGERDDADRGYARLRRLAEDTGQPTMRWWDLMYQLGFAAADGRAEETEGLGRACVELGAVTGNPEGETAVGMNLLLVRLGDGDPTDAEPFFEQAQANIPDLPIHRAGLAWLYAETGRRAEAAALLAAADRSGFARPPHIHFFVAATSLWGLTACTLGDTARARVLAELLAPYPDHVMVTGGVILGSVAHSQGVLAATLEDVEEADALFAIAEAQHRRLRIPVWHARTRLEWARMRLRRDAPGDRDRAWQLLDEALETCAEVGLRRLEGQVRELRSLVENGGR